MSKLPFYQQLIVDTLGCTDEVAVEVEEIMRDTIFHSTLDWQSREQLEDGAEQAMMVYDELHKKEYASHASA